MATSIYRRMATSKFFQYGLWFSSKAANYSAKTYLAYNCIFTISETTGPSMLPTLYPEGDIVVHMPLPVYRFFAPYLPKEVAPAYHPVNQSNMSSFDHSKSPRRYVGGPRDKLDPAMGTGIVVGDLVVVCSMRDASHEVCKRVIGLAGDTILIEPREKPNDEHRQQWTVDQNLRHQVSQPQISSEVSTEDTASSPKYVVVPPGHIWIVGDNLPNSTDSRDYGPVPLGMVRGRIIAKILPWKERQWLPNSLRTISQH